MAWRWIPPLGGAWLLLLTASAADARDPDPASIDPRLHTLVAGTSHRLLVYRICSPEHCWSDSSLQWLGDGDSEPVVKATKPVAELGYGSVVRSARWDSSAEPVRFEVQVVPSHTEGPERTLLLFPTTAGRYEARWKDGGEVGEPALAD